MVDQLHMHVWNEQNLSFAMAKFLGYDSANDEEEDKTYDNNCEGTRVKNMKVSVKVSV